MEHIEQSNYTRVACLSANEYQFEQRLRAIFPAEVFEIKTTMALHYYVDIYMPKYNIAIMFDDTNKEVDINNMQASTIKQQLGCTLIRVKYVDDIFSAAGTITSIIQERFMNNNGHKNKYMDPIYAEIRKLELSIKHINAITNYKRIELEHKRLDLETHGKSTSNHVVGGAAPQEPAVDVPSAPQKWHIDTTSETNKQSSSDAPTLMEVVLDTKEMTIECQCGQWVKVQPYEAHLKSNKHKKLMNHKK